MLPRAEAGVPLTTAAMGFLPRGPGADREREQLRAGEGLVVLHKNLLLSSGGRELSQRDDDQGHKHRRTQEGGDDNGTDSSGPQRACRDREQGGMSSAEPVGSRQEGPQGSPPHPAQPQPPGHTPAPEPPALATVALLPYPHAVDARSCVPVASSLGQGAEASLASS